MFLRTIRLFFWFRWILRLFLYFFRFSVSSLVILLWFIFLIFIEELIIIIGFWLLLTRISTWISILLPFFLFVYFLFSFIKVSRYGLYVIYLSKNIRELLTERFKCPFGSNLIKQTANWQSDSSFFLFRFAWNGTLTTRIITFLFLFNLMTAIALLVFFVFFQLSIV